MMAVLALAELLAPLREDPARAAILLDVDGTLAPIVQHPDDAHMPERTRRPLIDVARRYGLVGCVSGRRAADARRIVSLGTIAYLGAHGSEILRPGATTPEVDGELQAWAQRVRAFAAEAFTDDLRRLRVRLEDKESIVGLHWRGVPDEDAAFAAMTGIALSAERAGYQTHWGRKVLEIRPPLRIDKGVGVVGLLRGTGLRTALYCGDDATDIDAFRGLDQLVEEGYLETAIRVGVRLDEGPSDLEREADAMVEGTDGVRELLNVLARP